MSECKFTKAIEKFFENHKFLKKSELRKRAILHLLKINLPTTKNDRWQNINLNNFNLHKFTPHVSFHDDNNIAIKNFNSNVVDNTNVSPNLIDKNAKYQINFFNNELSNSFSIPQNSKIKTFENSDEFNIFKNFDHPFNAKILEHLDNRINLDSLSYFEALNLALANNDFYFKIKKNTKILEPIYINYVTCNIHNTLYNPKNYIVIEPFSEVTIIENYLNIKETNLQDYTQEHTNLNDDIHIQHDNAYTQNNSSFVNSNTTLIIGEGAIVNYYLIQSNNPIESQDLHHTSSSEYLSAKSNIKMLDPGYLALLNSEITNDEHLPSQHYNMTKEAPHTPSKQNTFNNNINIINNSIYQEKNSLLKTTILTTNNNLNNINVNTNLIGENAKCHNYILSKAKDYETHNINLTIYHKSKNCNSNTIYRSVLYDNAKTSFLGNININQKGEKNKADLKCDSLLLSNNVIAGNKPQLEINCDDVQCSHGATCGHLDQKAIYYLQTRGIPFELAQNLLINAFLDPILRNITVKNLYKYYMNVVPNHDPESSQHYAL